MRKIMFLVLILMPICFTSCLAQNPTNSFKILNQKIEEIFNKSQLPGFSVVVVDENEILYQHSLGYADIASNRKFSELTVQNIGSVSKTFIGVALMKAVEEGKIKLDDPINKHLPFDVIHPKFPSSQITIRHLANHTSGINDGEVYLKSYFFKNKNEDVSQLPKAIKKYAELMKKNIKIDESKFLELVLKKDEAFYSEENFTKKAPGSIYHYSNLGATLAAFVIENAVGMSYENFTRKYIFEPLAMSQTGWDENDFNNGNRARAYLTKDIPIPDYEIITKADGGLVTNTTDFGKYLIEMIKGYHGKGSILTPKSYKEMFTRNVFGKESSGIFWGVSKSGNPNHSGSDPGVITIASVNPRKNIGIFFMSNIDIDNNKKSLKSIIKILNNIKIHNWSNEK